MHNVPKNVYVLGGSRLYVLPGSSKPDVVREDCGFVGVTVAMIRVSAVDDRDP